LQEIREPLRRLLSGVAFLRDYVLGNTQGLRKAGAQFCYFLYPSRGLEETGEPFALRGAEATTDNVWLFVHGPTGAALYLSPFFHWGLAEGDRAQHLLWLQSLDRTPEGGQHGRFRHPVLRQEVRRGFPAPDDPEGDGVLVADYLAR